VALVGVKPRLIPFPTGRNIFRPDATFSDQRLGRRAVIYEEITYS